VAGCNRGGFRVCQFSIQRHHIHLIVEATNRVELSRGMQGLTIRLARSINQMYSRRGRVFADRYFARALKTPREVKNALNYVLNNALRHKNVRVDDLYLVEEDAYSSAAWFDGWRRRAHVRCRPTGPPPVAPAKTWLLTTGWRRHGLLSPVYIPPGERR
jgi:REP element-mobilizing transposase RayT